MLGLVCILGAAALALAAGKQDGQEPGGLRVRSYEPSPALGWTEGQLILGPAPDYPGDYVRIDYKGHAQGRLDVLRVSTSRWSQDVASFVPRDGVSYPTRSVVSLRASSGSAIDTVSLSLPVLIPDAEARFGQQCYVLGLFIRRDEPVQEIMDETSDDRCQQ